MMNQHDLAQDWHAFKRYASTIVDISDPDWINKLDSIPDEGNRLVKDYDEWWIGRLIIQGLKSAIGDHGAITLILIPSALKRIMGKVKEWRKKYDRTKGKRQHNTESCPRNRIPFQRPQTGLATGPNFRAASG